MMMNRSYSHVMFHITSPVILIGLILSSMVPAQPADEGIKDILPLVSIENIKHHTAVLGHDSLGGRGTGSPGIRKAAYYIAHHLEACELEPIGDNNSFFRRFPLHGDIPLSTTQFEFMIGDSIINLRLYDDYVLYNTGTQTFIPAPLPLVFV